MLILGEGTKNATSLKQWAKKRNATQTFINNADLYIKVCKEKGVNWDVAYVQYAKETGYGKFGGVLDESYCNPCGLKNTSGGSCTDPNAHKRFKDWEEGINAHVDHLALYAGKEGYPLYNSPDPRHFPYLFGRCKTVESLSGNWAPSSTYGTDLVKMISTIEDVIEDEIVELTLPKNITKCDFKDNKVTIYMK